MTASGLAKRCYCSVLPASVRLRLWHLRRQVPRQVHELRWKLASETSRARWTDRRLEPHEHYWLFILGCNNSGTTLLAEILGAHPLVRTLPKEGQRLTTAIPNSATLGIGRVFTQRLDLFRWTEDSLADRVARLRYDWAYYFTSGSGVLLEKSPPNAVRSRWLQRYFGPSRFIVIVRSPYAVCEGIARRKGHSIEEAATHWTRVHEILRTDTKYLERCLSIRYEDFCERLEEQLQRMERFLGLGIPFDRTLLGARFSAHNIDGKPRAIENLNARSIHRLSSADIDAITRIAGTEMRYFGYEPL